LLANVISNAMSMVRMEFSNNLPQNNEIGPFWGVLMQPTLCTLKKLPNVPHLPIK